MKAIMNLLLQHVKPQIILMFGVNGSGKTTTLAKLAGKVKRKRVKLINSCSC